VRHLRSSYLAGHVGHGVSHKNARGKGGKHALDLALRQRNQAGVDCVAIFIDTDQDWNDRLRTKASKHGIDVVESSPCLEAWLLRTAGLKPADDTDECKRTFAQEFGGAAHDERVYPRHFGRARLDASRLLVTELDQLLKVMGV
jgi:hypothetical protein